MDFDSPDVMKEFPGLYGTESSKKCKDDSDFSDEAAKNDSLIGKKKDKKDKKDKEKGYAALEGESSGDDNSKSRSPSKYKKAKSFKFSSKSKERRDKSKEKDVIDKKKEKDKKLEKKVEKGKLDKHKKVKSGEEYCSLADALPIFGVSLELSVERSKCHDGLDIPLPVRQCIDYLEVAGMSFEGIYKVSGTKSKVVQIRKMFNNRENVNLFDYDVPTTTSLLKMFLRDLPDPLFTNDLLIRFEEAGAILSSATREKHLRILIDNLPPLNKLLLSWLLIHLDNISLNERINKMSRTNLGASLNHTFHVSSRLLTALIQHSRALFPELILTRYVPPLSAGSPLPSTAEDIQKELEKQESLLNQIHMEMNCGCIIKQREELLWEVQRIITQLKRKMKSFQKDKDVSHHETIEKNPSIATKEEHLKEKIANEISFPSEFEMPDDWKPPATQTENVDSAVLAQNLFSLKTEQLVQTTPKVESIFETDSDDRHFDREQSPELKFPHKITDFENFEDVEPDEFFKVQDSGNLMNIDKAISLMRIKNNYLLQLRANLIKAIQIEHKEIDNLLAQLKNKKIIPSLVQHSENLDKVMELLHKENQILQIKKINLVRQIIEQQEICIDYKAKIELHSSLQK
ncbi:ralA-binding protein 1-like [Coccinella septempunctata]|uniref:ralA-binding protein 1-like n=1 Tax=Coccinella septempunctata TaxID=41139 RepID=UPI001D09802E|nr:ralA-binding protein 1-like [Coccinella septempunctata]